jgi:hypothetical protein
VATIAQLTTDLQTRFNDTTGRLIDSTTAERYLNIAYREFCTVTEALIREYGFVIVANQILYTLPTDIIKVSMAMWMKSEGYPLYYRPLRYFSDNGLMTLREKSDPLLFTLQDADTKIRLWPTPSAASASTTMNDAGGISDTDTSVILTSATNFRDQGMIKIENELIFYYAKSGNTLNQLVRGYGGTTAATHADGTSVSQVDLHIWYVYHEGTLASTATPQVSTPYHDDLVVGALYWAYRQDGRDAEAGELLKEWQQKLAKAKAEYQKRQKDSMIFLSSMYEDHGE